MSVSNNKGCEFFRLRVAVLVAFASVVWCNTKAQSVLCCMTSTTTSSYKRVQAHGTTITTPYPRPFNSNNNNNNINLGKHENKLFKILNNNNNKNRRQTPHPIDIRGGGGEHDHLIASFSPELLVSGSVFSFLCILYGAACAIDPRGTARLLYGHDTTKITKKQQQQQQQQVSKKLFWKFNKSQSTAVDDSATIKFLMRFIGSIVSGIGLTAAFSVASDIKQAFSSSTTTVTTTSFYYPSIAIGFLPRVLLYVWYAFVRSPPSFHYTTTSTVSLYNTKAIWICHLLGTVYYIGNAFHLSSITNNDNGYWQLFIIGGSLLSFVFTFTCVQLVFNRNNLSQEKTKHETLLSRQLIMYDIMSNILLVALLVLSNNNNSSYINNNPSSAFLAIGITSIIYAASQLCLTLVSKEDVKISSPWSSISIIALSSLIGTTI